MEAENKNKSEAAGTEPVVMEGTKEMGYWEFKKAICTEKGWQLRRIDPQTYEVIDSKHERSECLRVEKGFYQTRKRSLTLKHHPRLLRVAPQKSLPGLQPSDAREACRNDVVG